MLTIALINQKGGCGKTTCSINLAACLAHHQQRTLLVDMDPQGHCAVGLAVPDNQIERSLYDVLATSNNKLSIADVTWQIAGHFDLAPASIGLAALETELHGVPGRQDRLAEALAAVGDRYDYCIIDCPPNVGLLTFNAMRACTEVIIPVETGYFSLHGLARQLELLESLRKECSQEIRVRILATLYDIRTKLAREVLADLREQFGGLLMEATINFNTKLKEAASFGQPITEYDPASKGFRDFAKLARELMGPQKRVTLNVGEALPAGVFESGTDVPPRSGHGRVPSEKPWNSQRANASSAARSDDVQAGEAFVRPNASAGVSGNIQTRSHETFNGGGDREVAVAEHAEVATARAIAGGGAVATATMLEQPMERRVKPASPRPVIAEASAPSSTAPMPIASPRPVAAPKANSVTTVVSEPNTLSRAANDLRQQAQELARRAEEIRANAQRELGVRRDPAPKKAAAATVDESRMGVRRVPEGVLFNLRLPQASSVAVAGDFNQWSATSTTLSNDGHPTMFTAIVPLPPGKYRYRVVVDGQWQTDPHNPVTEPNPFGELNSVLEVG